MLSLEEDESEFLTISNKLQEIHPTEPNFENTRKLYEDIKKDLYRISKKFGINYKVAH